MINNRPIVIYLLFFFFENFEPTKASLLSQSPTPSLDATVKKLISEENCRLTHHMLSSNYVLATPFPQPPITAFTAPP